MQSPEECHPCSDGRRICANHVGQTLTVPREPGCALVGIVPTAAVAVGRQHSGAALNLAYKYGIHATSMICSCINLLRLNKIATRSSGPRWRVDKEDIGSCPSTVLLCTVQLRLSPHFGSHRVLAGLTKRAD